MPTIFLLDDDVMRDVKSTGGSSPTVQDGRLEYYVFKDSEAAGEVVRKRWQEMADDDEKEFTAIIGEKRLVQWATGKSDSFGISSFEEFLDRVADAPEEDLASYDGTEREGKINLLLADDLDIDRDEEATIDWEMLRKDIREGDLDSSEFPGEWEDKVQEFYDEDAKDELAWIAIKDAIEANEDESFDDIRDSYRFMDVVAYRHN